MSPSEAISSPTFRIYMEVIAGVMAAGFVAIAVLRLLGRDVAHAWASYRGWLVMVPTTMLCIYLGRVPTIVLFTALALLGAKEFARATGLYNCWSMTGVMYLGIVSVGMTCAVRDPWLGVPGWYGMLMALPVFVVAAIFLVPIVRNRSQGQLQAIALAIIGFIYIGWMFGHLAFMANSTNAYGYILYLLVAVELNDVAAYTFGKAFGKHPLRSNISPKKTWEGAIGAVAVSLVLPFVLRFSFPHFDTIDLLRTGLIVGVGGQLGDLSISIIKRDVGVKDMGSLIRGHGGVLDRIDSLIYVAPLFFHATGYYYGMR